MSRRSNVTRDNLTSFCRRRLAADLKNVGLHPTVREEATLAERINKLRRNIGEWIELQHLYIPRLAMLRAKAEKALPEGIPPTKVQDIPLWLPSAMASSRHGVPKVPCDATLQEYEWRFREGQAHEALEDVRDGLRLRAHHYVFKDKNVRGVRHNTRANEKIAKIQRIIDAAASVYRVAWRALEVLGAELGKKGWRETLKPLKDDDVRAMREGLFDETEGTRTMSWIWLTQGPGADVEEPHLDEGALSVCPCRWKGDVTTW